MEKINVLSLFDGISCGQVALQRAGIEVGSYFSSEIDKYAIEVTQKNYPKTIQLGDVKKIRGEDLPHIDIIMAGSPCFVEGTKIICKNEIKNIEDVRIGDEVLTHKGNYKKVLKIGGEKKDIYALKSQGAIPTYTTSNHPYYVRKRIKKWNNSKRTYEWIFEKPIWLAVKDISIGDFVGTPIIKDNENPYELTEEECFLLGAYIGDGHTRKDYRKEKGREGQRLWQLILSIGEYKKNNLQEKIKLPYSLYPHGQNIYRMVFSNKRLVMIAEKHCGVGAENKFLSKMILNLPVNLLGKVIEGYEFTDGSHRKNTYRATTVSCNLVYTLSLAIAKIYQTTSCVEYTKRPSKTKILNRIVNQKDTWTISYRKEHPKQSRAWIFDNIIWNPVKSVEKEERVERVFNLEVENDNSYVANNHIVHNCQGFSSAGHGLNFEDPRSILFFEFVRLLKEIKPKWFLLENVKMKKEFQDIISENLGVEPFEINSNLVSAQNRKRLYWTNLKNLTLPHDKKITLKDILEKEPKEIVEITEGGKARLKRNGVKFINDGTEKARCLTALGYVKNGKQENYYEFEKDRARKLTPIECERLQNLPDRYTEGHSNTQRYKMLGNCWTVDVVAHLLKNIKRKKLRLKKTPKNKIKVFSCFSGVGGFELGLSENKFEVIGVSEIDKHCNSVLRYRFPRIRNYGDISKIEARNLPDFDLLTGGFPCQDASISGKRKGLAGKETGLFRHLVRILEEKKPRYFLFENVVGLFNVNRGWDFARVQIALAEIGYDVQWQTYNSKDFGVPQNRERVFFIGYNRERCGREILLKRSLFREACEVRELRGSDSEINNEDREKNFAVNNRGKLETRDIANCIDANYWKGLDNHGQRTMVLAYSKSTRENHIDHRANINTLANTLTAGEGCRSQSTANFVCCIGAIDSGKQRFDDNKKLSRNFKQGNRVHSVDGISPCLNHKLGNAGGRSVLIDEVKKIRRLTPLETERLMGWPDCWTKYGINGKGEKIIISDSQRYRMCGNGVVSNVVKFIANNFF